MRLGEFTMKLQTVSAIQVSSIVVKQKEQTFQILTLTGILLMVFAVVEAQVKKNAKTARSEFIV